MRLMPLRMISVCCPCQFPHRELSADAVSAELRRLHDIDLLRFLRARAFDPERALTMLRACCRWRTAAIPPVYSPHAPGEDGSSDPAAGKPVDMSRRECRREKKNAAEERLGEGGGQKKKKQKKKKKTKTDMF
jgi:hypothetical protein